MSITRKLASLFRSRATGESWRDDRIPEEQWKIVQPELELLRAGTPVNVHLACAAALKAIPGSGILDLLEVGCASGYYSEVISRLTGTRFRYTGGDYSDAMLSFAARKYPAVQFLKIDIRNIDLTDRAYDVVLSGAVLIHVRDWKRAVAELARVCRKYLVLHRTPVTQGPTSGVERPGYAGVPFLFNQFNNRDLDLLVRECGFGAPLFQTRVHPEEQGEVIDTTLLYARQA